MLARKGNKPKEIIVNHSGDAALIDQTLRINEWHKHEDFPQSGLGYYIGYHYLINKLGIVTQTRIDDDEGAHTKGHNFSSLGIGLEGDFNIENPTEKQCEALGKLLVEKTRKYWIASKKIAPHRAYSKTSCYGNTLPDDWARNLYKKAETNPVYAVINKLLDLI